MDVNEKIVICWLQSCKNIFTIADIEYDNFHSSVDILGINLNKKEIYDIEVKFKARIKIDESTKKQNGYLHIKKQLFSEAREIVIKKLLPKNNDFKILKVLVTTKRFLTVNKFDYWTSKFEKDGITLWYFDDIVKELSDKTEKLKKANDEVLQTLRLLNQFKST